MSVQFPRNVHPFKHKQQSISGAFYLHARSLTKTSAKSASLQQRAYNRTTSRASPRFSHPPRTCIHFASIEYTGGIIKNTSGTRECWRINKTFNWQKGAPTGVPVYYTHSSSRSPTFCSFSPSLSLSREKHTQNLERKHTHTDTIPDSFAQSRFSSCE